MHTCLRIVPNLHVHHAEYHTEVSDQNYELRAKARQVTINHHFRDISSLR